ncbi:MFS transporter [Cohnella algarum]|uniref:MFS transporter n=1 Tax=Cohnella algarum TaxID=2044859 RepID=UPI00196829C9|nr:MFS transporter [Cohnella algarum]MBN2984518.1 MFS transporter [Cohnella algarum]
MLGAEVLGFADDAPQMSLLFACGAIGALFASLSLPALRSRFKPGAITIAGLAASGLSLFGVALGGHLAAVSVSYLLWQMSSTLIIVNGITLRQQLTPDELQGRVHAGGRMIAYGGSPFGALLGGLAASGIGVPYSYAAMAGLMIVLGVAALGTPLRHYAIDKSQSSRP